MKPEDCILFSGAANGAEAAFGAAAERHGGNPGDHQADHIETGRGPGAERA